ncbi:fungal specific transcription factor [Akanthomyces lecanii RCEF 1005]|uniref:Fungal specific transcription factor n=1 Tax=Akanthomyces lecanii RCEF 1005 TaxID=1081108 RepID=A0A168JG75_CORDF|nr:fungal specific transcription factor [Akanthomyces lecanii RCEF 1005]
MDRFWGLRSGLPVQVSDDDIHVSLPETPAGDMQREQFLDPALQIAGIGLARLAGTISQDLYGPKKEDENFMQREQKLLALSQQWLEALPGHLRLLSFGPSPKTITVMHLQLNYCIMLAISPALLHMLSSKAETGSDAFHTSPAISKIREVCVHTAKHSFALSIEAWASGSIGMFSYDFPGFLFTAALALLVSAYIQKETIVGMTAIDTVNEVLQKLADSGNLSARDFLDHLNFVIKCFEEASIKSSRPAAELALQQDDDVLQ